MSAAVRQAPPRPAAIPWVDRGDSHEPQRSTSAPRSTRDLDILRSLANRVPAGDAGSHNNLGVVYYGKSLYAEAVEQFERALEIDPGMQVAERNLQIVYFATGYYDELVEGLHVRLRADAEDHQARHRLALTYIYGGDPAAGIREWRTVLRALPRAAWVYEQIARAEARRGDLDAALVALRNAAALAPREARIQLRIGEALYHRGMHADACGPLELAVALDDTLAEGHHLLSFVFGELGDNEKAARAAERAAALNPGYLRAEPNLSLDQYSIARYEELVGQRSQRPRVAEGSALTHYNLGLAFRQKALYDEALREFELATERGEDAFLVLQARAEMVLLRGGGEEATELYNRLIEQEPASPKLWNELGVAEHQAGGLEQAEHAYLRALELDPIYALAWNNLGIARHHRGQDGEAEDAFRSALREGRALAGVWRNLGLMLERTARVQEGEIAYRQALDADPGSAAAWTGLGMMLLTQGRAEDARVALSRAIESDAQLAEARYHLAFALSATGDYAAALRETRRALELSPYIPSPRFRLLIDLQFEEAGVLAPELDAAEHVAAGAGIASFEFEPSALEAVLGAATPGTDETESAARPDSRQSSSPRSIEWLASARAALEGGEPALATSHVQRAMALGANPIEALVLQGEIYLASGASGEAAERFRDAIAEIGRHESRAAVGFDSDDALRRALLGASCSSLELRRFPEAVDAAERLCELMPNDVRGLIALGEALHRMGDFARAANVLEQARAKSPRDVELLTRLGQAYTETDQLESAEAALREALASNAGSPAAQTSLGRLLVKRDRPAEARHEFSAALVAIPSYGAAAFGLAELESAEGRPREAIHVLADFLTVDPYHLPALVRLGDLLFGEGLEHEAGIAYRRVLRFEPAYAAALEGLERLGSRPESAHSGRGVSRTSRLIDAEL